MPSGLKTYYWMELKADRKALGEGNVKLAWRHLEKAHILGQAWPSEQDHIHLLMLIFGIKILQPMDS